MKSPKHEPVSPEAGKQSKHPSFPGRILGLHAGYDRWPVVALLCLSGVLLAACSGGGGGSGGTSGAGSTASPAPMLLTSVDGGASLLGQVTQLPASATDTASAFMKFEGTPWIQDQDFNSHGLVFNSTDNKFYGVLNGTGADGLGVLMSFDPATDQLTMLKSFVRHTWPKVAGLNGEVLAFEQPSGFFRKPLLSPDGKSLLLRASLGGVADRGALIHVNIDPASASYLNETLVYSFFDYEKSQGTYCESLRAIGNSGITEMAWGKDAGGADVVYMVVGGVNYDMSLATGTPTVPGTCNPYTSSGRPMDKIKGRMFALKPGDASDLSKPWAYALGYTAFDPLLNPGRQIYWDTAKLAIRWTTEEVGGGLLNFYAGNATGPNLYRGAVEQCYRLQGLLPLNVNGDAIALCSGLNGSVTPPDSPPRIFHYKGNDVLTQQANFGGWYADKKFFRGATSSLVSRRLFVNGGDLSDGCVGGSVACQGKAATLEELDPATGYVQRELAAGDSSTIGYNFLGDPAVGGSIREPMADRYVVWLSAVVKGHSNVLNKYDRATGLTTTLALDPKNGAHPDGQLLDLGNGQALGLLRNAAPKVLTTSAAYLQGTGGYAGGVGSDGSREGHYLMDLKTKQILVSVSQDSRIKAFSRERVKLDDGTVWEALVYTDGNTYRTFNTIDPSTAKLTPTNVKKREEFDFPRDSFALAGRASAALYLPFWNANVDATKGYADTTLGCIRADTKQTLFESDAFGPAQGGFGNAHRIVFGATYSAANRAMYLATSKVADADQGTIFEVDKNIADTDVCKGKPVVTALVTGLTDVPSTKFIALKSGALVYGTSNGKLMKLDVTNKQALLVADLKGAGVATSQVKGYLTEVFDNAVAAVVFDYDTAGNNTGRRLVTVNITTAAQSSRDVSQLISESETYPGVMRLNQ